PSVAWPTPGELAALRRKVTDALAKLTRGRHAAAIRQLRQTVGALIRRGAWADAADGAMPLAATLLRRGRPRDALKVLDDVRTFAGRSGGDARLLDAAVLAGEAWIDLARLDEAETVLAAAVTSATTSGDRLRIATSSLALARCLFWRGKYDDAAAALSRPGARSTARHPRAAARGGGGSAPRPIRNGAGPRTAHRPDGRNVAAPSEGARGAHRVNRHERRAGERRVHRRHGAARARAVPANSGDAGAIGGRSARRRCRPCSAGLAD